MDPKQQTVATYNNQAQSFANKFDQLGVRAGDIEEIFSLIKKDNPKVLEIGCGNGRDALEIIKHTNDYLGLDISEKLIDLAKQKVPTANFIVADIENYVLPDNLDVIIAFASLIHVPKDSLKNILDQALVKLNPGGLFRLSMKAQDEYGQVDQTDDFGSRTYYFYSKENINELARGFVIVKNDLGEIRGQKWLEVILQKG